MAAVFASDLFVLVPWVGFGVALIIFYLWLRRPPRSAPPRQHHYVPPPGTVADADQAPVTEGRSATCTAGSGHKKSASRDRRGAGSP